MKYKLFKNINKNSQRGFTLIETLVAILILMSSVAGMIIVSSAGASNLRYAKNKAIASHLASEGVEMIRNIRDSYLIDPALGWSDFATLMGECSSGCAVDPYFPKDVISCDADAELGCQALYIDNGAYGYSSGGEISPFTRVITVKDIGSGNQEVEVFSTVYWKQGENVYSEENYTFLMNWIDPLF
ncbi:type II secretion system protein [Candidatus Nomurabacteria bacterium]|nr:type II secretion system protein [Candidatus Nomurabacteria bacterium]USN94491.1 MAG: type II secretion system protein [Candidatus Nomurabacteria bacterium]